MNYSIQLIEQQAQTISHIQAAGCLHFQTSFPTTAPDITTPTSKISGPGALSGPSLDENPRFDYALEDNAAALTEALEIGFNCSSARVLQWPILADCCDASDLLAPFFEAATFDGTDANRSPKFGRGIQQEDVSALIRKFLRNVHTKNPILDPVELRLMARKTSEDGFGWDRPSCLVLIACALASLSAPFTLDRPGDHETSCSDASNYSTAEEYYTASRKRIGLLGSSLLATQCSFLLGVYELYSMRPLAAWLSFSRACMIFQTYLATPSRHTVNEDSSKQLEQRLYWSCLKSECEMRDEVDLPPTGLAKVEYPDIFPSPPNGSQECQQVSRPESPTTGESLLQYSWYYYLSEIACRRIANRISNALHKTKHDLWHTISLSRMERIALELEGQLSQWFGNIPNMTPMDDQPQPDELNYMLDGRFLSLNERIWRPFLYLAIHHQYTGEDQITVSNYAQKCLDLLVQSIDHGAIKHRHHGAWYMCRQMFTMALLLLAAVKSRKIDMPMDWRPKVEMVLSVLKYWELEAPDLCHARSVLESALVSLGVEDSPTQ